MIKEKSQTILEQSTGTSDHLLSQVALKFRALVGEQPRAQTEDQEKWSSEAQFSATFLPAKEQLLGLGVKIRTEIKKAEKGVYLDVPEESIDEVGVILKEYGISILKNESAKEFEGLIFALP